MKIKDLARIPSTKDQELEVCIETNGYYLSIEQFHTKTVTVHRDEDDDQGEDQTLFVLEPCEAE